MAQMGLGKIGGPNVVFKRKYRWTFAIQHGCGNIPETIVKLAARPNLTIEEQEINFLHGKTWIPGKGTWETITVTYYDVSGIDGGGPEGLFSWLATVYDFTNPVQLNQSSKVGQGTGDGGYGGIATLKLYDGCGTTMETWVLGHVWPQAVNFGELDYSSSEEVTIELTLRYTNVQYTSQCGLNFAPCCAGC
jgi:hypothetical protein